MEPPVPCILLRASAKYPTKLRRNYPRSRSGCLTCRQRKKKCDEAHPQCAGCLRNQLSCVWPVGRTAHRDRHEAKTDGRQKDSTLTEQAGHSQGDQASQASQASQAKDIPASQSSQSGSTPDNVCCCAIASAVALLRRPTRPLLAWEERRADGSRDESPPAEDPPEADVTWSPGLGAFSAAALPVEARRVAAMTPLSATMLRAFIVRTAGELAITAGPANPFLAAVLPLAYSDDLVMHCVVALGGANLSAETALRRERTGSDQALVLALGVPSLHEATTRHYACVLRSLRAALRSLQPADTPQVLRTLLVLLLLAIYECSSWNVLDGGVFAHLGAARQLVAWLRAAPSVGTADDEALFGALLEVYAYLVLANRVTPDGALDHVRRVVGPDGSAADEDFVRDPALLAPGHPYAGVRLAGLHKLMALIPPVSHLAGLARQSAQISSRRLRARAAILRRRAAAWQLPAACLAQAQNDQDLVWWRAMGEVYRHALLVYLETAEMEGTRDDDDGSDNDNDDDDDNNPGSPDSLDASSDLPPLAEANLQRYIEAIGQATLATGLVASRFVSIALWPLVVIGTVLDRDSERSYLLDGLRSIPAFWGAIRAADLLELQWRCRDAAAAARPPKTVCQGLPAYYGPSGLARVMRENKINLCIY